jgi:eukaryotic-like serine/threonine-protein kinase
MTSKSVDPAAPPAAPATATGSTGTPPRLSAARAVVTAATLPAGSTLGRYRIERVLGEGTIGTLFAARQDSDGKPVAIKALNPGLVRDEASRARFLQHAKAVSWLKHPHVVDVSDFGHENGISYLVMELLEGEDLAVTLARTPSPLDVGWTVDVLLAICAGVFAGHGSGIVHGDLKPQNVFLTYDARGTLLPKVLDFGLCGLVTGPGAWSLTNPGSVKRTIQCLSPEQVRGAAPDRRSDGYALGVILYQCLTGRLPHEGDRLYAIMSSISAGRYPAPRVMRPDLSPQLEAIMVRALGTRPEDRFFSVHDLGRALLPFASPAGQSTWSGFYASAPLVLPSIGNGPASTLLGYPVPLTVRSARPELPERPRPGPWLRTAIAAAVLGSAAGAYLSYRPGLLFPRTPPAANTQQTAPGTGASAAPAASELPGGEATAPVGRHEPAAGGGGSPSPEVSAPPESPSPGARPLDPAGSLPPADPSPSGTGVLDPAGAPPASERATEVRPATSRAEPAADERRRRSGKPLRASTRTSRSTSKKQPARRGSR